LCKYLALSKRFLERNIAIWARERKDEEMYGEGKSVIFYIPLSVPAPPFSHIFPSPILSLRFHLYSLRPARAEAAAASHFRIHLRVACSLSLSSSCHGVSKKPIMLLRSLLNNLLDTLHI
jgi:hypothetical protein